MTSKVLIVIGDAAETLDTIFPLWRVIEEGWEAVVAAPDRRVRHLVMHEVPPDWEVTGESPSYHWAADIAFRDMKPEKHIGLFPTGGCAPEFLRYDPELMRITRHFFEADKPMAVVCHGAGIVATAGVFRGKRMATVPKCRFDVEACGATFANDACTRDGNMVSGRTSQDDLYHIREWVQMLRAYATT